MPGSILLTWHCLDCTRDANGRALAPLGLECGSQKLSDFFVNNKIPQAARAKWPLVLSGESVVWVVGLRIAHDWRLQGDENEILHLSLKHND